MEMQILVERMILKMYYNCVGHLLLILILVSMSNCYKTAFKSPILIQQMFIFPSFHNLVQVGVEGGFVRESFRNPSFLLPCTLW